ncbi:MAG: AraC family transcriptional regulator [Clostridia bacterium]|nr:AraC family transcriptional regulator [Clostridia bacterium]
MLVYELDPVEPTRQNSLTVENAARSFPFYVYECGHFRMGERYYTRRDGLENYLLIFTVSGCGRMTWHGRTVTLREGTFTLIDCREEQEYGTAPGEVWDFYYIHFGSDCMEGYRKLLLDSLTVTETPMKQHAAHLFEELLEQTSRADLYAYSMHANAVSVLLSLMIAPLESHPKKNSGSSRAEMQFLADYIRDHCELPLQIEDFAALTHLSKYHMIRRFSAQIGMTPYKYMNLCRINRAQVLLRDPDRSLADISETVGYNEPAVFIRQFRCFHHMTPGEYRRHMIY